MSRIVTTVLFIGIALRVGMTIALPAGTAFDNHFEPVKIIREQGRVPDAAECWECYQPPAYYLLSAGTWTLSAELARLAGGAPRLAEAWGKKSMQWVSCAAGCLTLWLTLLILRRSGIADVGVQAAALGVVAFLPAHIQMSGMATNDALTYAVATGAILAALRAQERGWRVVDCVLVGALAGMSVLCKAYGAVTVAAVVVAVGLYCWSGRRPRWFVPASLILLIALVVGSGPALRNLALHGKLQVDNFDKFKTEMRYQPPQTASAIDFLSFRFGALLESPWLHVAHLDSLWTELYGRLWFDYEGFNATLGGDPGWEAHERRCRAAYPKWNRERWDMRLNYATADVPPHFRWIGIFMYWLGLPITLLFLAGITAGAAVCIMMLRRERRGIAADAAGMAIPSNGSRFAIALPTLHFLAAVCVPVVQSLRLPHFAAMKVAFALSAVSSLAVAAAWVLARPRGRLRAAAICVCSVLLALIAFVETSYVLLHFMLDKRA